MKKLLAAILAFLLSLSMAACNSKDKFLDFSDTKGLFESDSLSYRESFSASELPSSKGSSFEKGTAQTAPQQDSSKTADSSVPAQKNTSSYPTAPSKPTSSAAQSSSTPVSSKPQETPVFSSSYLGEIERGLFDAINAERVSRGLNELTWSNTLYRSAKLRSDEILSSGEYSHTRPPYRNLKYDITLKQN